MANSQISNNIDQLNIKAKDSMELAIKNQLRLAV